MIYSYSLLATLAVIVNRTISVASFSNQHIRDQMRNLEHDDGDDILDILSNECLEDLEKIEDMRLEDSLGDLKTICESTGFGKVVIIDYEGTCPGVPQSDGSTESGFLDCLGKSCTIKELQAMLDAVLHASSGNDDLKGCTDFTITIKGSKKSKASKASKKSKTSKASKNSKASKASKNSKA